MSRALVWAALTTVAACRQPVSAQPVTPATVAGELVEAGCVTASSTLAASVQADVDGGPPWLACMLAGGSVAACGGCP